MARRPLPPPLFDHRAAAEVWITRKETETGKPGGFERLARGRKGGPTLATAINRYIAESEREIGRTKAQVLNAVKSHEIAKKPCDEIGSPEIVAFMQDLLGGGRKPQTVNNYLSHLSAIFQIAKPAWGLDLDPGAMAAAMIACKRLASPPNRASATAARRSKRWTS